MTDSFSDDLGSLLISYQPMSKASLDLIIENSVCGIYEKEAFLVEEGARSDSEFFLLKGILHRQVLSASGELVTTGFYSGPLVLTPHFARSINKKSIFSLQALTEVYIASIPVVILDSLRYSYDDIRLFGLKVVEQELLRSLESDISYRSLSAKHRLFRLRKSFPNIENQVPHSIIASYLGITPVSFSRLRKETARL